MHGEKKQTYEQLLSPIAKSVPRHRELSVGSKHKFSAILFEHRCHSCRSPLGHPIDIATELEPTSKLTLYISLVQQTEHWLGGKSSEI